MCHLHLIYSFNNTAHFARLICETTSSWTRCLTRGLAHKKTSTVYGVTLKLSITQVSETGTYNSAGSVCEQDLQ